MSTDSNTIKVKTFEHLSPYVARYGNVLYSHETLCCFDFFGYRASLYPLFGKSLEECELVLSVRAGTSLWKIALEKQDFLLFHDSVKNSRELKYSFKEFLPDPVRQALIESVINPFLIRLSDILEMNISLEKCEFIESREQFAKENFTSFLAFSFNLENHDEIFYSNNMFAAVPEERQSLELLEKLEKVLADNHHSESVGMTSGLKDEILIPLCFCIGRTQLCMQDLKQLSKGDIVVFDDYYYRNSCIRIYPCFNEKNIASLNFTGTEFLLCSVEGTTLTVIEWGRDIIVTEDNINAMNNEETMQDIREEDQNNLEVQEEGIIQSNMDELAVMLHFELDSRAVTLGELQSIKAGYTFALDTDTLAPVNLVVNGKNIGKGKIVDIHGTLGVQVTNIVK